MYSIRVENSCMFYNYFAIEWMFFFKKIIINLFRTQNKKIANKKLTLPEKGAECPYP